MRLVIQPLLCSPPIKVLGSHNSFRTRCVRARQACGEPGWQYSSKRLKFVAQTFRNLERPLKAEMLRQAFMFDEYPDIEIKECSYHGYHFREWAHCCTEWLTI
jgi:hypothetical protein